MADTCPHCGGSLVADHKYCSHCSRRAEAFKLCPACDEPISASAGFCPHCSRELPSEKAAVAKALQLKVRATHLGAFFAGGNFTGLFLPPIINIHDGRVTVTKWTLLGLHQHNQELQVSRIASVRYTKGIFWGGLLIETFGGAAQDFAELGFRLDDAKQMAEELKACLQD